MQYKMKYIIWLMKAGLSSSDYSICVILEEDVIIIHEQQNLFIANVSIFTFSRASVDDPNIPWKIFLSSFKKITSGMTK